VVADPAVVTWVDADLKLLRGDVGVQVDASTMPLLHIELRLLLGDLNGRVNDQGALLHVWIFIVVSSGFNLASRTA
jgi:hypothetical protein